MLNFIKLKLFYLYPFSSWINKYLKYKSNRYSKQEHLYEKTCKEIQEYTGEPLEAVIQKYKSGAGKGRQAAIFENQYGLTKKMVDDFYKNYSYYIYELPIWNAERARPYYLWGLMAPVIISNSYRTVLDYGGGAGDLCIELAKHGLDVSYYDISRPLFNFAKWRFEKRALDIEMYDDFSKINRLFDCIISFDVFEHLKDLPTNLEALLKNIRKGGSLIFSGAFSGGSLHLEENEIYDDFKILNNLLSSKGMKFTNKFAQFYFYKKL